MHSSGSILRTITEQVRVLLDLPDVDAKYSDNYLVANLLGPAMTEVLARLHLTNQAPYFFQLELTLEDGVHEYLLPPSVQEVVKVSIVDADGIETADIKPGHTKQRNGGNWRISGAPSCYSLVIGDGFENVESLTVTYVANGDMMPHLGTGSIAASGGKHVLTCATTPTLGLVDRRKNATQGMVLRILPSAASSQIESRMIQKQEVASGSWKLTVDEFDAQTPPVATIEYEVVPMASFTLVEAVAALIALKLASKTTQGQYERILLQYKKAMKTLGDMVTNIQTREGTSWHRDTVDRMQQAGPFERRY